MAMEELQESQRSGAKSFRMSGQFMNHRDNSSEHPEQLKGTGILQKFAQLLQDPFLYLIFSTGSLFIRCFSVYNDYSVKRSDPTCACTRVGE